MASNSRTIIVTNYIYYFTRLSYFCFHNFFNIISLPAGIQTQNLHIRSVLLYSVELQEEMDCNGHFLTLNHPIYFRNNYAKWARQ